MKLGDRKTLMNINKSDYKFMMIWQIHPENEDGTIDHNDDSVNIIITTDSGQYGQLLSPFKGTLTVGLVENKINYVCKQSRVSMSEPELKSLAEEAYQKLIELVRKNS